MATAAAGALLLGFGATCSTYPTYKDLPIDCTAQEGYEFLDLGLGNFKTWYAAADFTPDAGVPLDGGDQGAGVSTSSTTQDAADPYVASASVTPVEAFPDTTDGGVCGNTTGGVLRASHNDNWGGFFGTYGFGTTPQNATDSNGLAMDGIAFWARAPGQTSKGFTLSFSDNNTTAPTHDSTAPNDPSKNVPTFCTYYGSGDGGAPVAQGTTPTVTYDPNTGTPLTGGGVTRAPYPNECGNSYNTVVTVTSEWHFYTVPFDKFQQGATPNRVPNGVLDAGTVAGTGLLISNLRFFSIHMPKESEVELWIAGMVFYRKIAQ